MDYSRIDVYEFGGQQLSQALSGLTRAQLLAVPIPGTWSLQQIAVHMLDSDAIGTDRMKRIASMEKPLLIGYDESAFNRLPGIEELDVMDICEHFAENRRMTAVVLRKLPSESYARYGIHNEIGRITLAEMLEKYIHHLEGHLDHIVKKRELVSGLR